MNRIKKLFLSCSTIVTLLFFKVGNTFGADVKTDIFSEGKKYMQTQALYGPPDPKEDFFSVFGKIALFVLLPLCIIAIIIVGIIAFVKHNKKKQQDVNTNQSTKNSDNKNV